MAYNRWIYDELEHHQVLGAHWGVHNGPPYPLDRSLSDGNRLTSKATGSPQGKKRTPARGGVSKSGKKDQIHSDYGDSLAARAKRKYENYKKTRSEERAREAEEERKAAQKDAELYKEQQKRLESMNLSVEARRQLRDIANEFENVNDDRPGEALKTAIDLHEKRRNYVKEHGTADEVMKLRDSFSKEDMEYISSRLDAEAKIRQFSSKPVEQIPVSKSKGENLYEKGSAKDVYRNRTELTVEQLETVQRRLNAENQIGEIASKQVDLDSRTMERLKKARDVLKVLGESADSIQKIQKIFPSKNNQNQNNQNNQNNNNKAGKALEATRNVIGLVNVVREVSGATNTNAGKNKNKGTTPAHSGGSGGTSGGSSGSSGGTRPASGGSGSTPPSGGTTRPSSGSGSASAGGSTTSSGGTTRPASAGGSGSSSTSSTTTPRRPGELPDWLKRMRGEK